MMPSLKLIKFTIVINNHVKIRYGFFIIHDQTEIDIDSQGESVKINSMLFNSTLYKGVIMCNEHKKILGPLIKKIHWRIDKRINETLKELDLTTAQSSVLRYLDHAEKRCIAVSQKDIEKYLNASNPTISGILDRLEDKGFINRINDNHDARKKIITLTDKARKINQAIVEKLDIFDEEMLSCLDDKEREELFDYLERIIAHLKESEVH